MERRIILNNNTMESNLVNNDFKNLGNEKQNSLASGIRIGLDGVLPVLKQQFLRIQEVKSIVFNLGDLKNDWRQDNTFIYTLGLIEYQCKVNYLPFCLASKENYEKMDLSKIYTPVFHFEFEALNTAMTIYQSHWIMPYSLAWFLENYPDSNMDEMVRFAAKENGYWERIKAADRELQKGTQLSIF
jgi:hypothetical protein